MMMLLLAKIAKLSWLEDPDIKNNLVVDITKFLSIDNQFNKLVGLQMLEQLILEMAYLQQGKNLTVNRRVSLSFRDSALYDIYRNNLQILKVLAQ